MAYRLVTTHLSINNMTGDLAGLVTSPLGPVQWLQSSDYLSCPHCKLQRLTIGLLGTATRFVVHVIPQKILRLRLIHHRQKSVYAGGGCIPPSSPLDPPQGLPVLLVCWSRCAVWQVKQSVRYTSRFILITVNQNTTADTRDDCTLQSKQPWMHASYSLVKNSFVMWVKCGCLPASESALYPLWHPHIRIIPSALNR